MGDLVERLRDATNGWGKPAVMPGNYIYDPSALVALLLDAAAEIERLMAELAEEKDFGKMYREVNATLTEERDALRAALVVARDRMPITWVGRQEIDEALRGAAVQPTESHANGPPFSPCPDCGCPEIPFHRCDPDRLADQPEEGRGK